MESVMRLAIYKDDRGNEITYTGLVDENINIVFRGSNNKLIVSASARIVLLHVQFDCDNGHFAIGSSKGGGVIKIHSRVGQDAAITVGNNVSMTGNVYISSVEGSSVVIGDDVMFASGIQVRADDAHPIFDVSSGERINVTEDIVIGSHVWVGNNSSILGGADIRDGSVIGLGSVVKGKVPNNCIAVGAPARVVRRDIAWERPHLSLVKPFYKPDSSTVKKSAFWNYTEETESFYEQSTQLPTPLTSSSKSLFGKLLSRFGYQKIS
ncbi:acyltransferase [Arthrobacter sp. zg-Y1219]|uniref:acyltransferase n=1 Tax=Arthrobacter sp. zg-Y1219 TaxID=3049067 RepID=UPI0024C304A4|nr:acyltransferase [Arthrobacter sp. zg-Y1219]MDK1359315.1 acyltransferase [Arthrobacter sp. zg-Y1219]